MNKIHHLRNEIFPLQFPNRKLFRTPQSWYLELNGVVSGLDHLQNTSQRPQFQGFTSGTAKNSPKWHGIGKNETFLRIFCFPINKFDFTYPCKNIVCCDPSIFLKTGIILEIRTYFFVIQEQLYIYRPSVIYLV